MPGIETVRNGVVFPVFILIVFIVSIVFVARVNAYRRDNFNFYTQIILRSGVMDVSVLRG